MINEEAIKHSYELFKGTGYSNSYEDFKTLLQGNPEAVKHAHKLFTDTGYTKSIDDFSLLVGATDSPEEALKKKEEEEAKAADPNSDLYSEDSSWASPVSVDTESDGRDGFFVEANTPTDLDNIDLSQYAGEAGNTTGGMMDNRPEMPADMREALDTKAKTKIAEDIVESSSMQESEEAVLAEAERKRVEMMEGDVNFQNTVQSIDAEFVGGNDTPAAIASLREKFGKYGFTVRDSSKLTDNITLVSSTNEEYTIDMDNLWGDGEVSEEAKKWIAANAAAAPEKESTTASESALRAKRLRTRGRENSDGSTSSVNFMPYEEDGIFKVVPTLFPIDPNIQSSRADRWMDLGLEEAKGVAEQRGEVFEFSTMEEANAFANGGWETTSTVGAEMREVYTEAGYDYEHASKLMDEYNSVQDKIQLIDKSDTVGTEDVTDEDRENFPEMFLEDGSFRSDLGSMKEDLKEKRDVMIDAVYDDEQFEELREKADVILQKSLDNEAAAANLKYKDARIHMNSAVELAENSFGMSLEDLVNYVPKNDAEIAQKTEALDMSSQAKVDMFMANERYNGTAQYYDAKNNKAMMGDFVEGWGGTAKVWRDGLKQGRAAEEILLLSMNPNATRLELANAANNISKQLNSVDGSTTAALGRFNNARGYGSGEISKAIDSPAAFINWGVDLAASSMSMMLPYGSWLVGGTTVTGATVGGIAGATGFVTGPGGVVTTVGGAVAGAGHGLTVGMSATSFAMEYTNAVLDAARNQGFDPSNPTSMLEALETQEVWDEGRNTGLRRGIPIAMMDMVSGYTAGKIFTAGKSASVGLRLAQGVTERVVFDPVFEGLGEFAAQKVAGQEVDMKEIIAEMGGAVGSKMPNMAMTVLSQSIQHSNASLAENFSSNEWMGKNNERPGDTMRWADKMEKNGKISAEVADAIRKAAGRAKRAQQLLEDSGNKKSKNTVAEVRLIELLELQDNLENSTDTDSKQLSDVKAEIKATAESGQVQKADVDTEVEVEVEVEEEVVDKTVTEEEIFTEINRRSEERGDANGVVSQMEIDGVREDLQAAKDKPATTTEVEVEAEVEIDEDAVYKDGIEKTVQAETGTSTVKTNYSVTHDNGKFEVFTIEEDGNKLKMNPDNDIDFQLAVDAFKRTEGVTVEVEAEVDMDLDTDVDTEVEVEADVEVETEVETTENRTEQSDFETMLGFDNDTDTDTDTDTDIGEDTQSKIDALNAAAEDARDTGSRLRAVEEETEVEVEEKTETQKSVDKLSTNIASNFGKGYEEANSNSGKENYNWDSARKHTEERIKNDNNDNTTIRLDSKPVEAVTEKGGFLGMKTVEVSPAEEGGTTVQARATHDAMGNKFPEARNYNEVLSSVWVADSALEGLSPEQKEEVLKAAEEKANNDLNSVLKDLGDTKGLDGFEIQRKLQVMKESMDARFQMEDTATETKNVDVEALAKEMNDMPEAEISFEQVTPSSGVEIDPAAEAGITDAQAQALGFENAADMTKTWQSFEGIPMFPAMSDMLGTGVVQDAQGQDMEIGGGLHFNTTGTNQGLAWAGVSEAGAQQQVDKAKSIYAAHKDMFDALWAEGRLPEGQIPMVVMQMGKSAVNSNEASFRFIESHIKSFSVEAQTEAMTEFNKAIDSQTKVKGKAQVKAAQDIQAFIKTNGISNLGQLVNSIIADADKTSGNTTSALSLPTKSMVFGLLFGNGQTSNKPFIKALYGDTKAKSTQFTSQAVYAALGDTSVKDVKQGEAVAIQGVNVKENSGVEKANHKNYGHGPKGGLIAFLSNPTHGANLFSTWRAKSNRMAKADIAGNTPSAATVAQQTGGSYFADAAFIGDSMTSTDSIVDAIVAKIRFAFPSVQVSTDAVAFKAMLADPRIKKRTNKAGTVIYGVTMDGKIILNPDKATAGTAIHEFGHIWTDYLRTAGGRKGKALLAKGFALVRGTAAHKTAMEKHGDTDIAMEEALVELIANKGETIQKAAVKSNFKSWMNGMFKYIKSQFTQSKDLSLADIDALTLDEFIETSLADMFSGENLSGKFDATQSVEGAEARFSADGDISMSEIINKGREQGIKDSIVREVLKGRGFDKTTIQAAMEADMRINLIDIAPPAFGNIEAGPLAGRNMFADIATKVAAQAKKLAKSKAGMDRGVVRRFALETLKSDPIFQAQDVAVQESLVLDLDRHYGIKVDADVSREMNSLKDKVSKMKSTEKNVKKQQSMLAQFIRKSLPTGLGYTVAMVDKLIKATVDTTADNFIAKTEKIMAVVQEQRAKMANVKKKALLALVRKNGKKTKTKSNKVKGAGVSAEAQSFFQAAEGVISAVLKGDLKALEAIKEKIAANSDTLDALSLREANGETLSAREVSMLEEAMAVELFENLDEMTLEQVTEILEDMDNVLDASKETLKNKRVLRAEVKAKLDNDSKTQMQENFPYLFDENGNLLDANQLKAQRQQIWASLKETGIFEGLKKIRQIYDMGKLGEMGRKLTMTGFLTHLGTMVKQIDRKGSFLNDNIYVKLNDMISKHQEGRSIVAQKMDSLAQQLGLKNYKAFRKKHLRGNVTISGLTNSDGVALGDTVVTKNQLMRWYSLGKNSVQRAKLEAQGVNFEEISEILGQEAMDFADATVEFLSTEYFDGINRVYSHTNGTNLNFVENYFPASTLANNEKQLLEGGDFGGIFNAETAPALKDRSNTNDDVNLFDSSFSDTLESHFDSMEKFKAFSEGVKNLGTVMNLDSVKTLLQQLGVTEVINAKINAVVNEKSRRQASDQDSKVLNFAINSFVSYILSNKLMQIPKQMSSMINGFQDYTFTERKDRGNVVANAAQAIVYEVVDGVAYMVESAKTYAQIGKNFKKAMEVSPMFRQRVLDAIRGDVSSLETGQSADSWINDESNFGEALRIFQASKGATTTAGDILGVMGYMTSYNRNIKNGMTKSEALRLFENYNTTQQTKRQTEKSGLQLSKNGVMRLMSAFTSSPLLYMNNVRQSLMSMRNDGPTKANTRMLYLNLGAAQAMFFAAAHIFQFTKGDDEEVEEVMEGLQAAMSGQMMLESLPIISGAWESMNDKSPFKGELGINPFGRFAREGGDAFEEGYGSGVLKVIEMMAGFNLDPLKGAIEYSGSGSDEAMYEMLGVSSSYRPDGSSSSKPKTKKSKKSSKKSGK